MLSRKMAVLVIIVVLTVLDILSTQLLLNIVKQEFPGLSNYHEIESNPVMRYLMSLNDWLWIVVKLTITAIVCYVIHLNKVGFKVQLIIMVLLLATVLGNYANLLFGGR